MQTNILLCFSDQRILDATSFLLLAKYGVKANVVKNSEEAVMFISSNQDSIDLVLCDFPKSAKDIIVHSVKNNLSLHIICRCSGAIPFIDNPLLSKRKQWIHMVGPVQWFEELEEKLKNLSSEYRAIDESREIQMVPIDPAILLGTNPLPESVYIMLSAKKFVRLLREGYDFDQKDLDYIKVQKKISNLYVRRQSLSKFAIQLNYNLLPDEFRIPLENLKALSSGTTPQSQPSLEIIELTEQPPPQEKGTDPQKAELIKKSAQQLIQKQSLVHTHPTISSIKEQDQLLDDTQAEVLNELDKIVQIGSSLGFTPEIQQITKTNVHHAVQTIRNASRLSQVLLELQKHHGNYISSHSLLLSYIACGIAAQIEWKSDTTFQKLTLAAFLHDITLSNNELAAVQNLKQLAEVHQKFTVEEANKFKNHPIQAAEIAKKFKEVPPDVDVIISQHHERPDGTGFPRGLNHSRIGPLSAVFIVAHDLTSFMYSNGQIKSGTPNLAEFYAQNQFAYQSMAFKKILATVVKISV